MEELLMSANEDNIPNGPVQSTPGAAALAAEQFTLSPVEQRRADARAAAAEQSRAKEAAQTPNQRRLAELNKPGDDGVFSSDPVKQKAAVAELRKLLAAEASEEEKQAVADAPIGKLREQYGVDPTKVPAHLRESWDAESEATVWATFSQQGLSPEFAKASYEWYVGHFTGALGRASNVDAGAMEAEFRELAAQHGVAADVVDALVDYERQRLGLS
jgi:hypothetical protein